MYVLKLSYTSKEYLNDCYVIHTSPQKKSNFFFFIPSLIKFDEFYLLLIRIWRMYSSQYLTRLTRFTTIYVIIGQKTLWTVSLTLSGADFVILKTNRCIVCFLLMYSRVSSKQECYAHFKWIIFIDQINFLYCILE